MNLVLPVVFEPIGAIGSVDAISFCCNNGIYLGSVRLITLMIGDNAIEKLATI